MRRTKAQIAQEEDEAQEARRLHAQAAADHIRENPNTDFNARYRALAEEVLA